MVAAEFLQHHVDGANPRSCDCESELLNCRVPHLSSSALNPGTRGSLSVYEVFFAHPERTADEAANVGSGLVTGARCASGAE